jgi:hypothetical protein
LCPIPVGLPLESIDRTGAVSRAIPNSYGIAATGEPLEAVTRLPRSPQPAREQGGTANRPVRPEARAAARAQWKAAKEAAEAMVRAAEGQDAMGLAIAADDLDMALAKLWEGRATRDLNWRTILNHAQGMVRQLFAAKQVEQLTPEQCRCIGALLDRHLGPATKTTDDLNETIRLIEDAGFDPYGAIAGDPLDETGV